MTELKAGTRGTWREGPGFPEWECVVLVGEPDHDGDIVIKDISGSYLIAPLADFTPDPEPPTTVMVEMSVELAKLILVCAQFGLTLTKMQWEVLDAAAAKALREVGIE